MQQLLAYSLILREKKGETNACFALNSIFIPSSAYKPENFLILLGEAM